MLIRLRVKQWACAWPGSLPALGCGCVPAPCGAAAPRCRPGSGVRPGTVMQSQPVVPWQWRANVLAPVVNMRTLLSFGCVPLGASYRFAFCCSSSTLPEHNVSDMFWLFVIPGSMCGSEFLQASEALLFFFKANCASRGQIYAPGTG